MYKYFLSVSMHKHAPEAARYIHPELISDVVQDATNRRLLNESLDLLTSVNEMLQLPLIRDVRSIAASDAYTFLS